MTDVPPKFRILQAKARADNAQAHYEKVRQEEQDKCKHSDIVGGKSKPGDTWTIGCGGGSYSTAEPPFRVCRLCGYAEEGWSGYYKLKEPFQLEAPELERAEAMKLVIGRIVSRSHQYKLQYPERFTNRKDEEGNPNPLWQWEEIER